MNVEKLVRMANQIAANFEYGADKEKAAAGVADHLQRFWTPSMRAQIIEGCRADTIDLSELAKLAVAKLAEQQRTTTAA
jgi:formate dehydrogenase subunit delta